MVIKIFRLIILTFNYFHIRVSTVVIVCSQALVLLAVTTSSVSVQWVCSCSCWLSLRYWWARRHLDSNVSPQCLLMYSLYWAVSCSALLRILYWNRPCVCACVCVDHQLSGLALYEFMCYQLRFRVPDLEIVNTRHVPGMTDKCMLMSPDLYVYLYGSRLQLQPSQLFRLAVCMVNICRPSSGFPTGRTCITCLLACIRI